VKLVRLSIILILSVACQRESGFLERVVEPSKPLSPIMTPPPTPVPTIPPTPPPATPVPKKYSKNLEFKVAHTQNTIPKVDILWIIDNSGSMGDEQQNVIANTSHFMNTFTSQTQLQWKMGLLSTTVTDPMSGADVDPYVGFTPETQLDYLTPNPVPIFQNAVGRLGTGGSGSEQTFNPVLKNLRRFPSFLTPGAYLALIIVTDEEEHSPGISPTSFVTQLTALKGGDKSKIVVYGVFATAFDCPQGFNYTFSRYWDLMRQVTSTKYPLCNPQFGQLLTSIGEDLITRMSTLDPVLLLEARPIPSSIRLTYKGKLLKPGFKEDGGVWIYDPVYNVIRITNMAVLDAGVRAISIAFDIDPS
jgi:hypothetical protein